MEDRFDLSKYEEDFQKNTELAKNPVEEKLDKEDQLINEIDEDVTGDDGNTAETLNPVEKKLGVSEIVRDEETEKKIRVLESQISRMEKTPYTKFIERKEHYNLTRFREILDTKPGKTMSGDAIDRFKRYLDDQVFELLENGEVPDSDKSAILKVIKKKIINSDPISFVAILPPYIVDNFLSVIEDDLKFRPNNLTTILTHPIHYLSRKKFQGKLEQIKEAQGKVS